MTVIFRLILMLMLVAITAFDSFVIVKGSEPLGVMVAAPNAKSTVLSDMNYWESMADRLAAISETPANCHRTRLVCLTIAPPADNSINSVGSRVCHTHNTINFHWEGPYLPASASICTARDTRVINSATSGSSGNKSPRRMV